MHQAGGTAVGATAGRSPADADKLVVAVLQRHADTLLRVARRHSLCDEDAADAFQRGVEIFLRNARRLDADNAHRWLFAVVRNESVAVRRQREAAVDREAVDAEELAGVHRESPEEAVIAREEVAETVEGLVRLKEAELQAVWLKASGHSYAEIAADRGWSQTKVNRSLVEGRRRLQAHRDALASGVACARWAPTLVAIADGTADAAQITGVRHHLRHCAACRQRVRRLHEARLATARETAAAAADGATAGAPAAAAAGASGGAGRATPDRRRARAGRRLGALLPWPALPLWAGRLHEAASAGIGERLTLRALRVQSAVEVLSAGKVAAVTSAAIMAGGGVVAVRSAPDPSRHRTAARAGTTAVTAPPRPAATAARASATPAAAVGAGGPPAGGGGVGTAGGSGSSAGAPRTAAAGTAGPVKGGLVGARSRPGLDEWGSAFAAAAAAFGGWDHAGSGWGSAGSGRGAASARSGGGAHEWGRAVPRSAPATFEEAASAGGGLERRGRAAPRARATTRTARTPSAGSRTIAATGRTAAARTSRAARGGAAASPRAGHTVAATGPRPVNRPAPSAAPSPTRPAARAPAGGAREFAPTSASGSTGGTASRRVAAGGGGEFP